MSTQVTYNGVTLSFVKTSALEVLPTMDPSGSDRLYNRHVYTCSAVYVRGKEPAGQGESPADVQERVRHMLTEPRKDLTITVGGRPLLVSKGIDAANGPKPLPGVTVTRVTEESFAVNWGIEVCLPECDDNKPKSPVLSLRWTQTHDIDEKNLSTFTTAGRLIVASNLMGKASIDTLRPLCVPEQPPNTVRKASYTMQADGLALEFRFTDTEQYQMPPEGAVKLTGVFEKLIEKGIVRVVRVALRLEGRKDEPRKQLMATAVGIALARLRAGRPAGGAMMIRDGTLSENLGENTVQVALTAWAADAQFTGAPSSPAVIFGELGGSAFFGPGPLLAKAHDILTRIETNRGNPAEAGKIPMHPQIGIGLDGFGMSLAGCPDPLEESDPITPDVFGGYENLRMLAAAFRDPCLQDVASKLAQVKNFAPTPPTPPRPPSGVTLPSKPIDPPKPADSRLRTPALIEEGTSRLHTPANIQIINQLPPVASGKLTTVSDKYVGIYTVYEIRTTWTNDRGGRLVLAATAKGISSKVVQTHNDQIGLRVQWTAEKWGGTPAVPDWKEPYGGNFVCVDVAVAPEHVELAADGITTVHRISGQYDYQALDTTKVSVNTPILPWMGVDSRKVPAYPLDEEIIFGDGSQKPG